MVEGVTQLDFNQFYVFFPNLRQDKCFDITSNPSEVFNCIAFAMGLTDRWVDHFDVPGHWWPPIPLKDDSPEALVSAFEYMGFVCCDDGRLESGFDKVALYKSNNCWRHAARIVNLGECHSKMGSSFDIHHRDGNVFEGTNYGEIYQYMKRPIGYKIEELPDGNDCEYEIVE